MSPVAGSPDYDYTIMDKNGIRGVKDGKEFPISEEEWQRMHPEHRNMDCKECIFVADAETLLTFFVDRKLREKAGAKPVFVGKFTMARWSGHSGFYLFKCSNPECEKVCVDYPHGYTSEGFLFLRCDRCRFKIILYPRKYREIYERDDVHIPEGFTWRGLFKLICFLWTTRKWLSIEDKILLDKPLNIEDLEKLKIKPDTIVPRDLES